MPTKQINIPPATQDITMKKNQDTLTIHVAQQCNWCCSDPSSVFGGNLPADGLLDAGDHGPYTPVNNGTVTYNGVDTDKTCTLDNIAATASHTIIVTS